MIGSQIHHYTILDKLGAGGMGEVYLAEDTKLGRKVALKFLPDRLSSDPEFKARFEHEARAAATLNHPNIVTIHDLGEHDNRLFIVMEHVSGRTLAELIKADDISIHKALELGIQICDGLEAAHNAGIVHRDIKPANILVDDSGRARILDFGLAKSVRATTDTRAGTTLGTAQYESPEQTRGAPIDRRSDLFSYGSVLYEMVTGKLAFSGEYDEAVRFAITQEPAEPMARYKTGVPPQLEQVVTKLLEKEPDMRYQTAGDVMADIKRIQRELTQPTSQVTATNTDSKSVPNKFVVPAVIVVALLALVMVFKPWQLQVVPTQEARAVEDRLAVMYFDNMADPEDLKRSGEIVTDLLITDLTASPGLQVVSSQRLYDILKLLGREGQKRVDRDVASQIARKASARWMLTGSILRTEPNPVVTAQLVEVASGNVLTSTRKDGAEGEDLFALVSKVASDILASLDMVPAPGDVGLQIEGMSAETAEAYRYYLEGVELLHQYNDKEAQRALERAVELDSTLVMPHYYLSFVYSYTNRGDAAIRRAVTLSGQAGPKERLYILARYAALNERFLDSADYEKTLALYTKITNTYPEEKEAYYLLGEEYRNRGAQDRARSIKMFETVLVLDSLDKRAYNELAFAYHYTGDLERSVWAINKYSELVPNEANAYDSRADLYALRGNLDLAIENYRKAVDLDSSFVTSLRKLSYMALFSGDIEGAEALMRRRASHSDAEVRSGGLAGLKNISLYLGRIQEARKRMDHYLSSKQVDLFDGKENWRLQNELGSFFVDLWHISGNDTWLDSASALKPLVDSAWHADTTRNKIWTYTHQAPFYAYQGDFHTTDSLVRSRRERRDTTISWSNLFYWRERSSVAHFLGQYDTSAYYAELWCEESPLFVALATLGRSYVLAGRISDAVTTLERAATTYDNSRAVAAEHIVSVFYWLGRAYEESGWNDRAAEQYEKILDIWKDSDPGLALKEDVQARLANLRI